MLVKTITFKKIFSSLLIFEMQKHNSDVILILKLYFFNFVDLFHDFR